MHPDVHTLLHLCESAPFSTPVTQKTRVRLYAAFPGFANTTAPAFDRIAHSLAFSRTLSLLRATIGPPMVDLALIIFTGFAIPITYMPDWCRWINYIDPLAYAFEALVVNEFHSREFMCDQFVPSPLVPGYETVANEMSTKKKKGPASRRRLVMKYSVVLKTMVFMILYGMSQSIDATASADGWYSA